MSDLRDDILLDEDELLFADETVDGTTPSSGSDSAKEESVRSSRWKVLIADDDEEIHSLTKLVLADFRFEKQDLEFLYAKSGLEAVEMLIEHPDTALILLDVVMESDDAGLQTVRRIREELHNSFVRIILRTGQPGQAPEQEVVSNYDINDYKSKTELTAQKLSTTVTSALRSYRDIRAIDRNRQGLEKLNSLSGELLSCKRTVDLAQLVLDASESVLANNHDGNVVSGVFTEKSDQECRIMQGDGEFADLSGELDVDALGKEFTEEVDTALAVRNPNATSWGFCTSFPSQGGTEGRLILRTSRPIAEIEIKLLDVLVANTRAAYENMHLNRELLESQNEMILTLGEVVESRSKETANHVMRVGRYAQCLAQLTGLDQSESELLLHAAPLHDVGKIGIPDAVLNKPGRYDEDERKVMMEHSRIGWEILRNSRRELFQAAAIIAHQHHEKWDGQGYPSGLAGEDIHIYGRIVAVADVFDALSHARVYKPAMPIEQCLEILQEGRGSHFDPNLIDLFMDNLDEFLAIYEELTDQDVTPAFSAEPELQNI
jgi:response regulator RpfG family c-di-GMP phosphodiesterase